MACVLTSVATNAEGLSLKSMILMPGPLTESHAGEEANCEACHSSFDKSAQDSLCLACHEDIAADRDQGMGFHGRAELASSKICKDCHTDHKGRDYNIVAMDQDIFDHESTDFSLSGKHASVPCENCHQADTSFRDTPGACYDCHQQQDQHGDSLGRACGDCHTAQGWNKPTSFDHSETDFSLQGEHETLPCGSCHAGEKYQFEATECVSCHQLRDVHLGRYGQNCDRCHSERDWTANSFDHGAETSFALSGAHRDSACKSCHFGDLKDNAPATQCSACHSSNDIHAGRHGKECANCHNTRDWTTTLFDHGEKASWPLTGKHRDLSCLQCHQGSLEDELGSDCKLCHRADDVHRSEQMGECDSCHQTSGWGNSSHFDHELTRFPLEGMHAIATCESCHSSHEYQLAQRSCINCHQGEDAHKSALGEQCESCHTPNAWALWSFDHDSATDFPLAGAHAGLSCGSCHQGNSAEDVPRDCASCHSGDDRHNGSFGRGCERCHSSDSFGDIQWRK